MDSLVFPRESTARQPCTECSEQINFFFLRTYYFNVSDRYRTPLSRSIHTRVNGEAYLLIERKILIQAGFFALQIRICIRRVNVISLHCYVNGIDSTYLDGADLMSISAHALIGKVFGIIFAWPCTFINNLGAYLLVGRYTVCLSVKFKNKK